MAPRRQIGAQVLDWLAGLLIDQPVVQLELLPGVERKGLEGQLEARPVDRPDQPPIDRTLRLQSGERRDQIALEPRRDEVMMGHLWHPPTRKEVAEDLVVALPRQPRLDLKSPIGKQLGVDVIEALEVLADDEEVEGHVVQDIEILDLLVGRRMEDAETHRQGLPRPRR